MGMSYFCVLNVGTDFQVCFSEIRSQPSVKKTSNKEKALRLSASCVLEGNLLKCPPEWITLQVFLCRLHVLLWSKASSQEESFKRQESCLAAHPALITRLLRLLTYVIPMRRTGMCWHVWVFTKISLQPVLALFLRRIIPLLSEDFRERVKQRRHK